MSGECRREIDQQGRELARLEERVDGHRDRLREMHAEKIDRREFAPFKWFGMTAGGGIILLVIGALGKLLLKP